jgi:S1-C subfamily serine protease
MASIVGLAGLAAVVFILTLNLAAVGAGERSAQLPSLPATTAAAPTPAPLIDVADAALTSVVTVEVATARGERFGTGWLLDAGGDIVTNDHVVERQLALRIVDRLGGVHVGALVGFDVLQDVAVIRVRDGIGAGSLPVDLTPDAIGARVAVLASMRATDHGDITIETIARLHESIRVNPQPGEPGATEVHYEDMTVLRGAPVFQGNSGGPVIDGRGEVVGIVTATSAALSEAYAIPIGRVIAELRAFAARG